METPVLPIIGRTTEVRFPEWGSGFLHAKVDTGALFSTIHAEAIREEKGGSVPELVFRMYAHPDFCRSTRYRKVRVRSTSGHLETRYCVTAVIEIDGKTYETECTLADRSKMRIPVLLGRKLLRGHFLVDVTRALPKKR